jgi:hypothetical protein
MHKFFKISFVFLLACFINSVQAQEDSLYDELIIDDQQEATTAYDTSLFNTAETKQVDVRYVPAGKLDELKKDKAFWYAQEEKRDKKDAIPNPQKTGQKGTSEMEEESTAPVWMQGWFKTLMWIIIVATFIAIIIMFLSSSNVFLFRKKPKKIAVSEEEELLHEDIFSINYEKEINKAIAAQNYRLAIRYMYLRTLKELSESGIIQFSQEKTDHEYVMQLFGTEYYKDFFRITRHFEYAWYGQFLISAEAFQIVQSHFNNFKTGTAA